MSRILILLSMLIQFSCSTNRIGYYEPKGHLLDENVYKHFKKSEYHLIKQDFTERQLLKINKLITDKSLHLNSDLGTCEISGVIVLKNKIIYLTCGTAQIFICNNSGVEKILLNEKGNEQFFDLVKELRN
jgi:hypothetical protein